MSFLPIAKWECPDCGERRVLLATPNGLRGLFCCLGCDIVEVREWLCGGIVKDDMFSNDDARWLYSLNISSL